MNQNFGNPYLPSYEYVPDAEPYVFGDRLYIFGSHDRFNGNDFCINDYVGWSAPISDLSDWRYEGVIYRKDQDPMFNAAEGHRLFAPDVQQGPDGRYYLYYGFSHTGRIHVAVCDTPAGQYQYYGPVQHADGTPIGTAPGDMFQYDPGVLVDDDNRIYLYSGFCFDSRKIPKLAGLLENHEGAMVMELEPDMRTLRTEPQVVIPCQDRTAGTGFEGHGFFEASSIRKVSGKYYFIYSSENGHELCYAVSDRPTGGFVYGGILVSNGDIGYDRRAEPANYTGTNHGSIVQIGTRWYVFYHRQSNGSPYSRQGCAEPITILADGSIPQVGISSFGLYGKPFPGRGVYGLFRACYLMSASGACEYKAKTRVDASHPYLTQEGSDRENTPNQYLANMTDGCKAGMRSFLMDGAETAGVTIRGSACGELVLSDGENGACLAKFPVVPGDSWSTVFADLVPIFGEQSLWLSFRGTGCLDVRDLILQ